jgi:hypothetical protein
MRAIALAAAVLLATSLASLGCNKDEPKKVSEEPKKSTPVPSDMVFNDFLPPQGGTEGLAVRGVDGGLIEAGAGAAAGAAAAAEAALPADENAKLKVTEAGAEPRAARKYTFTANKTERRVIVIQQTLSQGGQKQAQPALQLTVDLTPKAVKPTGTSFEMKVIGVDFADKDKLDPRIAAQLAQVTQQLAAFAGMTATFDVDPHGAVGEVSMQATEKVQKAGAEDLISAFQQAVELMLPPLPDEPIGVGAKWERSLEEKQMGLVIKGKHTFELKDLDKDGGTVLATIEQKVPKRKIPDPRARGASVQVDATGTYTYTFRFDRIATKVQGELNRKETVEMPGEGGKSESITRETKIVHTMTVGQPGQAAHAAHAAAPAAAPAK